MMDLNPWAAAIPRSYSVIWSETDKNGVIVESFMEGCLVGWGKVCRLLVRLAPWTS
jgi:hypothetical protein